MAYTGIAMLCGDKLHIFYEYVSEKLGRPIFTHEFISQADTIKELSKEDFLGLCARNSSKERSIMIDREKVKKGLRDLRRYIEDMEWSDNREDRQAANVYWQTVTDAIELLKKQEAVKPKCKERMGGFVSGLCPSCGTVLNNVLNIKACGKCGQEVKWE